MLAYPVLLLRSVGPCHLLVSRLLVGILLVVTCCLAHGFDMMSQVHSEVLSSIANSHVVRTQRSFLSSRHVAAGGTFSSRLPFVAFFLSGPLSLSLVVFLVL
jgi:hypothetical protein